MPTTTTLLSDREIQAIRSRVHTLFNRSPLITTDSMIQSLHLEFSDYDDPDLVATVVNQIEEYHLDYTKYSEHQRGLRRTALCTRCNGFGILLYAPGAPTCPKCGGDGKRIEQA